ncbi:hypothetical protein V8E55_008669 [Tylopilus felleus]
MIGCLLFNLFHTMSEQQPSASQPSAPAEPQSTDSEPQSVLPPPHKPLHPPTPPHPYRIYGYKLDNEWFAKFAKDHNIGKPHWGAGGIESAVLGYLTLRLPGFQIHFVDDPSVPIYGYSICISLATNWNRKKLERAASRVPKWMEVLGTEEKPRWYKPTVDTIPPMFVLSLLIPSLPDFLSLVRAKSQLVVSSSWNEVAFQDIHSYDRTTTLYMLQDATGWLTAICRASRAIGGHPSTSLLKFSVP